MWPDRETQTALVKSSVYAVGLTGVFYSSGASAALIPDLSVMLTNFAESTPYLMRMVTGFAYVLGMFFVIQAILGMKHFGELRTMASQEHGLSGPVIEFFVGIALIYLPSTIPAALNTFWTNPTPFAYKTTTSDQYAMFISACFALIQVVGVIAFIKGLIILKKVGGGRSQQDSMGKAMSHMVGGVLCMNLHDTLQVLEKTAGKFT